MPHDLAEVHEDFRRSCRAFTDQRVRPLVAEAERDGRPPERLWKELGDAGLLGLLTPPELGGSFGDGGEATAVTVLAEELTRACGGNYPVAGVDDLKAGSTGTPVPGHAYAVVDDDGAEVPPGTKGNLVMTRPFPTLARTVWDDHERYLETYFGRFPGRYATNDEAVVDDDGHLWVLGRADDVINVAAHRLSTMEIEAVVGTHPRVVEAAVVGVPDATKGTVPVAFVTVTGDADGVADEVSALVGDTIGGLARPDRVVVTPAMPKTRTGKIMRRLMREVLLHGEARSDTSALEDPSSLETLAAAVRA